MKKLLCLMLALVLALAALSGCETPPTPTTAPPRPTEPADPTTEPATEPTAPPETIPSSLSSEELQTLRDNLPVMDGSTSLIPLEAGLRAELFGKTIEEATADVSHSSTWGSFYNLLEGRTDLIFSVPLSAEQERYAAECGVTLEAVPVAMEGFVFVVNAENPVDTLTRQQIMDIYSGKITNWSEVGGLDEEIIPYQRNSDSGSQNYMIEFMGDTPLMDAPTELRPASMFGLMDVIAVNDNSRAAIGYSVYAYAADMYGNGNEIKFIRVDGVAPSKASFADGSYPLMGCNYAIFNADEPADSPVRLLVKWMRTAEGQTAIARAGYVTMMDVGFDYTEETLAKYEGTGTGPAAPEHAPSGEYVILSTTLHTSEWGNYTTYSNTLDLTEATTHSGLVSWHITQLSDKTLENEINAWIDSQMDWVNAEAGAMQNVVDRLNQNYEYDLYLIHDATNITPAPIPCTVTVDNGFVSVAVYLRYWKHGNNEHYKYYRTETAVWDLMSGKRLSDGDLFCKGVDIDAVLNTYLQEYTQMPRREFGHDPEMKQDFVALPETGWHLVHNGIYIDCGGDTFLHGEFIPFDWLPDGILSAQIPRDFSDCLIPDDSTEVVRRIRTSDRDLRYTYYGSDSYASYEEMYAVELLKEEFHPNAAGINEDLLEYLNTYYQVETVLDYFDHQGYAREDVNFMWMEWYSTLLGGKYLLVEGNRPYVYVEASDSFVYYPYDSHLLYNLDSGEQMDWTELMQGDWLENSTMRQSYPDVPIETPYYEGLTTDWFRFESESNLFTACLSDGENAYYLYIPGEYIKF